MERLRLAKDGVAHPSPAPRTKSLRESPRLSTRRKSLFEVTGVPFQQTLKPVRQRLRRTTTTPSTLVNTDNAAWFASLPPAVRRKHFTQEEQVLFASERHSIILDAADELFHRHCLLQDSPLEPPSFLLPPRPQTSYFPDNADGSSFFCDSDSDDDDEGDGEKRKRGMANYSLDKFPWLEDEPNLDLRLDDYHAAIAETTQRQAVSDQRRSPRRNLSLSHLSLARSSLTSSQSNSNAVARAAPPSRSSFLPPPSPSRHQSKASISSIDPRATYYQDPTARMKLRLYLASPSKFDEAVEFGFPSRHGQGGLQAERPKTSPRLTNESGRTFVTDETPSLLGDDGSSHEDPDTALDPRTPEDTEFRFNRKSQKISNDRQSIKPQLVRNFTEQYAQSTTLDREMTIHMTLTRPDLRTPEALISSKVNSRPIEQSILPSADNQKSIWDTLPDDESKMKRFWRRLKMK